MLNKEKFQFPIESIQQSEKPLTIFTSDMLKVMEMHVIKFDMNNNDISIFLISFFIACWGAFFMAWCWVKFFTRLHAFIGMSGNAKCLSPPISE